MGKRKRNLGILLYNLRPFMGFEFLFKVLASAILLPAFRGWINVLIRLCGFSYLTAENVKKFVLSPAVLFSAAVAALCVVVISAVDICAVLCLLDCSRRKVRLTMAQTFGFAIRGALRFFERKNLRILPVLLVFLAVLHAGVFFAFFGAIRVPGLLRKFVEGGRGRIFALAVVYFLFAVFVTARLYVFHFFCLDKKDYAEAYRAAKLFGQKYRREDFLKLLGLQLLLFAAFFLASVFGSVLIVLVRRTIVSIGNVRLPGRINVILVYYLRLVLEVLFALSLPVGFSAIGLQFYEHRRRGAGEESGRPESESMREKAAAVRDARRRRRRRIPAAAVQVPVFLLTAGLFVWYNLGLLHGQFNIDAEDIHVLEVTAHRGASKYYPENTMPAFAGAVEQGADWIELDVQQSRDGQIFVMHDRNFRRTCGVNAFAWEIDYERIRGFDAGRWFDRKSRGVYPPLLSEVIELAGLANVRLNIELKPSGYEKNFEEGVLAVIREKHFEKNCVITSQKYSVLEKVKQLDPQIRTVYVMQVAYGRIDRLKAADDFSIEETFASARLIRRMHALGHHVYVWTVNNRRSINNVILNRGDNIITDNVPLAKECIHSSALTERMNRLVVSIEDLMY